MKKKCQFKTGFTLIELLVTITIISVLSGFLLPVLGKAREKGREITCLNNLKQIGVAVELYTQDWNGYTPAVYVSSLGAIYTTLNRYLRNAGVFWCPSSGANRIWDGQSAPAFSRGVSYGFNYYGTGTSITDFSGFCSPTEDMIYTHRNLREMKAPEQLIVAADSYRDLSHEFVVSYYPALWDWGPGDIHHGGCNVLFADGHVSWHSLNYLRSPNTKHSWNYDNIDIDYP